MAANDTQQATSVSAWKKAATHYPLLPSGVRVGIRIPDLAALVESGQIPNDLVQVALGVASGEDTKPSVELIKQQKEFTDLLVLQTVVEPKLTPEVVQDIPFEDKDFLVAIATRQRDLDAEGEHIAGLTKSERFRRFRRLGEFDENVEGL
jgi:hypothetical protein